MTVPQGVVALAYLSVFLAVAWATRTEEITDNQISIRFDKVNLKEWDENENNPTEEFRTVVASSASSYCAGSDCSLGGASGTSSTPFTEEDVVILPDYPADENADVQIVFYISLENQNPPDSENQYALKKTALEAILKDNKDSIANATGYDVVFIGDERVGAPLDPTMNSIMIPLAVGALLLLILITVCLHFREKRKEKKANGISTNKRAEIPTNDTHGEGIVLTSVNKNSAKPTDPNSNKSTGEKKKCREPRRKKKHSSSRNRENPDGGDGGSATTTQHISVHPIPELNDNNSHNSSDQGLYGPKDQSDGNNSSFTTEVNYRSSIPNPPPARAKRGDRTRSRQIDPPTYDSAVGMPMMDGAGDFLDNSDVASHSDDPGYQDSVDAEPSKRHSKNGARATDKEYLIKPSGRLPPLERISNSLSPAVEL